MSGPVTCHEAGGGSIVDQEKRFRVLAGHDALAGAIASGKARGTYVPSEYVNEQRYPPLTLNEHLEMLALGENLARYYRHPAQVDKAVKAGASWDQIAAATGTTAEAARTAYREWAEGQHQQYAGTGRFGLDDAGYTAALEAAGEPGPAAATEGAAEDTRRIQAIRAVLARFDWEISDRQYALEAIERIAEGASRDLERP
jgi:hypothetical protein